MFNKLKRFSTMTFEQCIYRKKCKDYQEDSHICNDCFAVFPDNDNAYCETYRRLNKERSKGEYVCSTS